ncbi:DNA primase [Algicella marina]|uniref:DNA primase n=1 Tax=Algicella marina TaxID=2683284 RepID=A0A6P1STA2_9RHOB|nr:DNA primase [Algicella marina]QHQ33904.1 DNA primase [Algicella marina]
MSLPPGFLDDLRTRTSIAQIVGRKVTWDSRKSNPGKGDYWAPCPFHTEKTASFHVEDKKGFYYCFGCHAKGDALTFIRETENVGFMEAVEILAREAGVQMPARDPQAARRAEERKGLAEIMELAVQFYRLQLNTANAEEARAYLDRRGLKPETRDRFEIGFAPDGRNALFEHLRAKGITAEEMDLAGLCATPEDGGQPYDRFRHRIIFPIRDAQGRAIALGGRAMDPNARAKYLNSPETPLFDKGRALYNHAPAREASGKSGQLIVAEGYMDVIALSQVGIGHVVAPLGTAITEDQLALMWRIADEPVIALDGDKAGLRAAMRLVDLALPLLAPGKSLRFVLLPEGLDPDDLVRSQGRGAMDKLVEDAQPMVRLLWQKETEGRVFDSPERRAALDTSLRQTLGRIADTGLRRHYEDAIREMRRDLFRPTRQKGGGGGFQKWNPRNRPPEGPAQSTRASLLAQRGAAADVEARVRESLILIACLNHPALIERFEDRLEFLPFLCPDLDEIRRALLQVAMQTLPDAAEAISARLGFDVQERLSAMAHGRITRNIRSGADIEDTALELEEVIARHRALIGHAEELRDAEQEATGVASDGLLWRIQQAGEARASVDRKPFGDSDAGDEETEDLRAKLQAMIDSKVWLKSPK